MSARLDIVEVVPAKTKTNPRGSGRNPRAGEPATIRVTMRLTPTEHAVYEAAAKADKISIVEWLRVAAEARLKRKGRA